MSVKRVLHIINGEYYSGAEKVQDLLALKLTELGYEIGFACLKPQLFPIKRISTYTPLFETPMPSIFSVITCVKALTKIVNKENYDLIHTHTPRAALIGSIVSYLSKKPFVHHVHSPTARDTEVNFKNIINSYSEKISLAKSSALIPVSNSLNKYLIEQGYNKEKIFTVPNGVPVTETLSQKQMQDNILTIGIIALFRPRKGIEVLLDALQIVYRNNKTIRLRAVGPFVNEAYEKQIKNIATQKSIDNIIDWVGFSDNINTELSNMDIFILPSLYGEGMPMVILEAMAAGVPIISTHVEGIPEVLDDQSTGIIVPPSNPEAIAQAIFKLIENPIMWNNLRNNAHKKQTNCFSDHSMAKAVSSIYREVTK